MASSRTRTGNHFLAKGASSAEGSHPSAPVCQPTLLDRESSGSSPAGWSSFPVCVRVSGSGSTRRC